MAGDIGHAGNTQFIAKQGIDHFIFTVGHADARHAGRIGCGACIDGQAVTFERINRQIKIELFCLPGVGGAHRQHIGVGMHIAGGGAHRANHPMLIALDVLHGSVGHEDHAACAQQRFHRHTKIVAVAGVFAGRVDAAADARTDMSQRRFLRKHLAMRQRFLLAAMLALERQRALGAVKTVRVGKDHQLAVAAKIEGDLFIGDDVVNQIAAVVCKAQQMHRGNFGLRAIAGRHKFEAPAPLVEIEARVKTQRRIAAQQPRRNLRHHAGSGQRRDIAVGKLPAVGIARFQSGVRVALDHGYPMTRLVQVISGGDADDAGAEYADMHII